MNGSDKILLSLLNDSKSIIHEEFENDLLNINSYDLNSKWKSFYTKNNPYKEIMIILLIYHLNLF